MVAQLNHTIVAARDKHESAAFLSEILGLPEPVAFGHFLVVPTGNDVSLDFADADGEIAAQHYAFLITEDEFDQVFARVQGAWHHLLASSVAWQRGQHQPQRRRTRVLLRGSQRALPGGADPSVRQRGMNCRHTPCRCETARHASRA